VILSKANPFEGPSFSRRNRLARLAWQIVWLLLFRPTPPPLHAWRCWLLRCFGARIGSPCFVYNDVEIWAPWNLKMGDYSTLGRRVVCYTMAPVSLGERAVGHRACISAPAATITSLKTSSCLPCRYRLEPIPGFARKPSCLLGSPLAPAP
jgi:acetyltransferase-like isoleucine patch superfamily enzyme